MASVEAKVSALKAEFEGNRKKFRKVQSRLKGEADSWQVQVEETEKRLEEALWEEALDTVENELKPLYVRERQKEAETVTRSNRLLATTRKAADKINSIQNDLADLRQEIKSLEDRLIQADPDGSARLKEALAFKKAEAATECEVPDHSDDAYALLRHLNVIAGAGDAVTQRFARSFGHVPEPAKKIYRAVTGLGGKLRTREDRLVMLAGIREPRIIAARDQVARYLDDMRTEGLIQYEKEGDYYLITDAAAAPRSGMAVGRPSV